MKNKIILTFTFAWNGLMGHISPVWLGSIYMFITGHSKGYAYDLGSESNISIMLGFVGLILWIVVVIPVMVWSFNKFRRIKNKFVVIPIGIFTSCFLIGIFYWE